MKSEVIVFKEAVGNWLNQWYDSLTPTTEQLQAYIDKGFSQSVGWATGRMKDDVQAMLDSYRRNENFGTVNANSKFPVMIVAMARDVTPTTGDWGARQVPRQFVQIEDDPQASWYGYRQAMQDVNMQVVIMATEESTARSLAFQFTYFLGLASSRRFYKTETWGQYDIESPVMLETPDVLMQFMPLDQKNMTILTVDFTLKDTIPYFDAPGIGEENDGSSNDPPGYPILDKINLNPRFIVGLSPETGKIKRKTFRICCD
jgi:hypothetical protein